MLGEWGWWVVKRAEEVEVWKRGKGGGDRVRVYA